MATQKSRKRREPRRRGRPRAVDTNQRERLLDAAIACFAADGVAATSLRNIALKAGVTPALVNYYFGSKEKLLDVFATERVQPVVAMLRDALLAAGTEPHAVVGAFVRGIHGVVDRYPWWPALWVREVLADRGALRDMLIQQISPHTAQLLAKTLAGARARGTLPADLDPRLLVVSLVGLTLFPLAAEPIWRPMFAADDIDRAALLRHTLALLDQGLGGSNAR